VISPILACASVSAPSASSGEVTASGRITTRPPAPAAITPAVAPADRQTAA